MTNVEAALNLVTDGMKLGLGSGSASERFLKGLGDRVKAGLKVRGVPTSNKIADLAKGYGIPLVELADALPIDLAVDGADEVDPDLNMIKGYGRALLREKIVAIAAKQFIILIGPERVAEKRVAVLGQRGKVPIEVVPFAVPLVVRLLTELQYGTEILTENDRPVISDNGNYLLNVEVAEIDDPPGFDLMLKGIPGVVETGLFLDMADAVFIETNGTIEELRRA
ncbi:ribose-5-phosphate isomerase RpiA [Limnoglobus roseus]|uniref:Ribose 5-phosphate isomerase A n=1 Tax=Limnoglobus roseus TaxID=2598579 RepID=A0A5C1A501_9BACT|nr:ribose-5-phosphate isomerase RpiA [Limnoglobus roseus]QEL13385.1 ribose-5-phosphate isomerase RpiA [Limnoglobus roseus]